MKPHPPPPKPTDPRYCPIERALARSRQPIPIMQVLRPIDTDADADVLFAQEVAPGIVDQHSVGLE